MRFKHCRRSTLGYLSFGLIRAFFLPPVVLFLLWAASVQAASELMIDDKRPAARLHRSSPVICSENASLFRRDSPTIFEAQADVSAKDSHPIDEDQAPAGNNKSIEPITRMLPIWGEKIREMGYELPLPFGAGLNLVYMDQGIDIKNLKIGFGGPSQEISWVSFSNASAEDKAAAARLDVWLLPFANIYGIFGYLDGEAELDVNLPGITINVPGIGPVTVVDPATLDFDIDYSGTTVGGGITLAGGYKNIFGSLDANYSYSDIDVVDGDIETLTISPRLGVLVDPASIRGSFAFWIGAMYMDYKQTVTDSINLKELDPSLPSVEFEFEIDIENEKPWNFLMGGQWEISKRWQVVAEGGIGNRRQLIFSVLFRF